MPNEHFGIFMFWTKHFGEKNSGQKFHNCATAMQVDGETNISGAEKQILYQ